MEEKNKPTIPFAIRHAEAKEMLVDAVNEAAQTYKIPFYLIEEVLSNVLHQVKENAKTERSEAAKVYEKQMKEAEGEGVECKKP